MGVLTCQLFTVPPNDKLERCAVRDADHITPGSVGDHVKCIQIALNQLSKVFLVIDGQYGANTAAAVVAFKEAQTPPLRQPWQSIADNVVGIRTIKALDKQMKELENTLPLSLFVSTTLWGDLSHDHSTCPLNVPGKPERGLVNHFGTPLNPRGGPGKRKINLGGDGETAYLGFEDWVTNLVHDGPVRPITSAPPPAGLPEDCASDICLRDSPITMHGSSEKGKQEILRIAEPGCRLTFCGDVNQFRAQLFSMGTIIEHLFIPDARFLGSTAEAVVITILKSRRGSSASE